MGIFKKLFGSDKDGKHSKQNPNNLSEIKKETEKLRTVNKAWEQEFNRLTALRRQAQKHEKQAEFQNAIENYNK